MKRLLLVSACLDLGAGLGLLLAPTLLVRLLVGAPLEGPVALSVARVGGGALLALGVACWLGHDDVRSRAGRGLIAAMFIYNVAAALVLAYAGVGYHLHAIALWPAVALHALMGGWCIACLRRGPGRR